MKIAQETWVIAYTTLLLISPSGIGAGERRTEAPVNPTSGESHVIAQIGGAVITDHDLEDAAKGRLLRLRSDEYAIKKAVLDGLIARALIDKEAASQGITVEALTRAEVDAKVAPVTEQESRAVFDTNKERYQGLSEAEALQQIATGLRQSRVERRKRDYLSELRKRASIRVLLEPPRVEVPVADAPWIGNEHAAVTVIEFSDFQCPFCARETPVLKRIRESFPDNVRIVFRHFPLPIHKDAAKAAEASLCAREQGKFWEMHDKLFSNQTALSVPDTRRYASELGLDSASFATCLDTSRFATAIERDVADGHRYGVSATPSFFVNGRFMNGAVPFEAFAHVVDEEIERSDATAKKAATFRLK